MASIASQEDRDQVYREKIIDAAYSCFKQHGFDKTNAGDIIDRSGVSRAKFYKLFKNKEAVIVEIIHRETAVSAVGVDKLWQQENTSTEDIVVERVFRVLKQAQENMYVRYLLESPDYQKQIVESASSNSTLFPMLKERLDRANQPLLDRARNTDVGLDEVICWLTYAEIVLLKLVDNADLSDAKLKRFIRDFVARPLTQTLDTA